MSDLHHHRRVRLCRSSEQRRAALHVLARPRGTAAQGAGPHAPEAQDAARRRPDPGRHRPGDRPHLQVRRPDRARRLLLDRGSGRDLDHPRPGADVAGRLGLLPPPARRASGTGGRPRSAAWIGFLAQILVLYLCYKYLSSLAAGDVWYVKELGPDRPLARLRDRHHLAGDHRRDRSGGGPGLRPLAPLRQAA